MRKLINSNQYKIIIMILFVVTEQEAEYRDAKHVKKTINQEWVMMKNGGGKFYEINDLFLFILFKYNVWFKQDIWSGTIEHPLTPLPPNFSIFLSFFSLSLSLSLSLSIYLLF